MAKWKVTPEWKKSVIERNYWSKGPDTIMHEIGWRSGEFIVYTDDDNPPNIEAGVDLYNCEYEAEMLGTSDGSWEEYDYDDCDDIVRELVEEFLDEGNSIYDLEGQGWTCDDVEMIIDCDLIIERLDENGNPTGEIVGSDKDEGKTEEVKPEVKIEPGAKWPF